MDSGLKQRLIGAAVLVALAVIFLPMLVQGPAPDSGVSDLPLTMPDAPEGDYETRDLPLVTPGAAPDGGAVGLDAAGRDDGVLPTVDTATAPPATITAPRTGQASASQSIPLGDAGVSAPAALPVEAASLKPQPMLPAATAGGNYAVHFGAYAGAAGADAVVRMAKAALLPAYRESTTLAGKPAWRVRIGPYATRAEAESARLHAATVRADVPARVVALDAEAAAAKVAAAAPPVTTPSSTPTPQAPRPTTAAAIPKPAATAPVAAAGVGFAVQLGAFGNAADATALRDRLRGAGFSAFTEQVDTDKGRLTRVRVGPVVSRASADQLKAQVKAKTGVDGIVRPHP